jgi:Trypsin-co-occurring domain 1
MKDHKIIPFEDAELGTIWIEVASESPEPARGMSKVGGGATSQKFDDALATLRGIAGKIIGQITDLPNRPDEVECKIGIKFNAEAGVVLAKMSSEGSLELTLKWKNEKTPA